MENNDMNMILYNADGKSMNDSWYAFDGTTCHAFFLERQPGVPEAEAEVRHIGHAVSTDMRHFTYKGTVISPKKGQWLDCQLATGSIAKKDDIWYMLFTAQSYGNPGYGFAIATSKDLDNWTLCEKMTLPVMGTIDVKLNDKTFACELLADPYIYPEKIDGWFYAYFNSHAVDMPINHRAAQVMMRTKDFYNWEPYKIAALDTSDRIETAQVWKHGDVWYMYGGAVTSGVDENGNFVNDWRICRYENVLYTSDRFDGPFIRAQYIDVPDFEGSVYIAKTMPDHDGKDIMLFNKYGPAGVIGPFAVTYTKHGIELRVKR